MTKRTIANVCVYGVVLALVALAVASGSWNKERFSEHAVSRTWPGGEAYAKFYADLWNGCISDTVTGLRLVDDNSRGEVFVPCSILWSSAGFIIDPSVMRARRAQDFKASAAAEFFAAREKCLASKYCQAFMAERWRRYHAEYQHDPRRAGDFTPADGLWDWAGANKDDSPGR